MDHSLHDLRRVAEVELPKHKSDGHTEHKFGDWYPYDSSGKEYRMCKLPYCRVTEIC